MNACCKLTKVVHWNNPSALVLALEDVACPAARSSPSRSSPQHTARPIPQRDCSKDPRLVSPCKLSQVMWFTSFMFSGQQEFDPASRVCKVTTQLASSAHAFVKTPTPPYLQGHYTNGPSEAAQVSAFQHSAQCDSFHSDHVGGISDTSEEPMASAGPPAKFTLSGCLSLLGSIGLHSDAKKDEQAQGSNMSNVRHARKAGGRPEAGCSLRVRAMHHACLDVCSRSRTLGALHQNPM